MTTDNPLRQFFRRPALYLKLPSGGKGYSSDAIDFPDNSELAVYPMTAIDEITYRTPDALYNGQATVNVIQSCVPDIKDAWAIPVTDIDTLLVAIRIASYGHNLEVSSTCPKCNDDSNRTMDLRTVLDSMGAPDYSKNIVAGDMTIFFKPLNYKNLNDNNQMQYENQKLLQLLPDAAVPDSEKMTALSDALKKITDITVTALGQSITAIKTPTILVSEPEYINDFLKNCDRALFNQIRDFIVNLKTQSEMKPMKISCPACNHDYEQALTLDMSSFFGPAS